MFSTYVATSILGLVAYTGWVIFSITTRKKSPPNPSVPTATVTLAPTNSKKRGHCEALYDFEAQIPGELEFKEGAVIELLSRIDENWHAFSRRPLSRVNESRISKYEGQIIGNNVQVLAILLGIGAVTGEYPVIDAGEWIPGFCAARPE